MTHTLSGNLILPANYAGYDKDEANKIIMGFARRRLECYFPRRDEKYRISTYDRDGEQPFIEVFDTPIRVDRWIGEKARGIEGLLAVRVRSGSHVGFSDTELARDVYDSARAVRTALNRMIPLTLYFDDEEKLYLPREFLQMIKIRK